LSIFVQSTDWVRAKLVQCSPCIFKIGRNLKDALNLQNDHENMLQEIKVSLRAKWNER